MTEKPAPENSIAEKIARSEDEWRARLTPEQFFVCRMKGTERPFSGRNWNSKAPGVYRCVACGEALFGSESKFDSRSGWPSFHSPLAPERIESEEDSSLGMVRTEVLCARYGSHLGHVFPDGPPPSGLRYCINMVALRLEPEERK